VVGGSSRAAGLAMAVLAGDLLCTFDKRARTVTIQHRRLVNPGADSYAWSDISDAALEKTMMSSGRGNQRTPVYRPVFIMKRGSRVPWTPVSTGDLKRQANCIAAVRAFTGWHSLPDAAGASDAAAIQRAAAGARNTRLILFPFLGIFIVVGAAMYVSQVKRYLTWQPVRARIVTTSVVSSSGDHGTVYRPVVSYAYASRDGIHQPDAAQRRVCGTRAVLVPVDLRRDPAAHGRTLRARAQERPAGPGARRRRARADPGRRRDGADDAGAGPGGGAGAELS